MPDTIVMRIVQNETTSANLLLSGDINAATIIGPDAERLDQAGLFASETQVLLGEQWYNHADGHPTSDPEVRMALTQALDLDELQQVLTSGKGTAATTLSTLEPVACPGDSVSGSLPASDPEAAKAALEAQGPLELTFLYDTGASSAIAAAAELAVQQWEAAGVTVNTKPQSGTATEQTLFGTGDWDIAWIPLNVSSPDQLVPFLSGPAVPNGTNFAAIENADYSAAVKEASGLPGEQSCDTWLEAESHLIAAADIVPFANNVVQTFGVDAEFETPGSLVPTSIRMLAQ
jgi:peptide/nickel transport system substrate-binding protein